MSVEDVARLLGVHVRTVRRLVKKGSLVAYRITSRVVRVDRSSVTRLLETTRIAGARGASLCPSENEGMCPRRRPPASPAWPRESLDGLHPRPRRGLARDRRRRRSPASARCPCRRRRRS
ncbi:MAG: helix-turn-helix domain-containing protein [Polyangiaceae bacterium]|nr:helix-turn-helix domain-containing protein [Polyangiaceae bacterium]